MNSINDIPESAPEPNPKEAQTVTSEAAQTVASEGAQTRASGEVKPVAPAKNLHLATKVSIRNLNFFYGDTLALKNINLPVYTNKVTAFIGPSGCGKSTLLRVLNRMYDLYPKQRAEGEVLLDGVNILRPDQDLNLLRARSAWCFKSRPLFRCRSTTISPSASSSMRSSPRPS